MKGYTGSKTPIEIRDLFQTPIEVFSYYQKRYNLQFDVAANNKNHLTELYYDHLNGDNALVLPWSHNGNWCNPPYSETKKWVIKAIEEMRKGNLTVMLVPADTSTEWFNLALDNCSECHLISGRISFIRADTQEKQSGNNKGSVVFIFDRKSPMRSRVKMISRSELFEG